MADVFAPKRYDRKFYNVLLYGWAAYLLDPSGRYNYFDYYVDRQ